MYDAQRIIYKRKDSTKLKVRKSEGVGNKLRLFCWSSEPQRRVTKKAVVASSTPTVFVLIVAAGVAIDFLNKLEFDKVLVGGDHSNHIFIGQCRKRGGGVREG